MHPLIPFALLLASSLAAAPAVTIETLHYASTIDPLPDLRARVAVPAGAHRVPVIVLMHGFSLDAGSFTDDTYRRLASHGRGAIVVGVEMRGRGGSSGTPDGGGREIHDILDAVAAVEARYAARAAPDAVHLLGYSGGGANVLSAAGRFPDRFASVAAFFPIADYGHDRRLGWWWQASPAQRAKLDAWIGCPDDPACRAGRAVPAAYAARAPIFALANYGARPLRIFHDRADDNVPVDHTLALGEAARRAGLSNVELFLSDRNDAVRWLHAAPNGTAPVIQAEPRILPGIDASATDPKAAAPALPWRGRLAIAGYLVTRPFAVWLGRGNAARGRVEYDLDARRFDITYDTGDAAREPWTLVLSRLRPSVVVTLTINGEPRRGVADANGTLRLTVSDENHD